MFLTPFTLKSAPKILLKGVAEHHHPPHFLGKNATLMWQPEYTVIFLNCKQKRQIYEWAFNTSLRFSLPVTS
jgi:hypothetical protein